MSPTRYLPRISGWMLSLPTTLASLAAMSRTVRGCPLPMLKVSPAAAGVSSARRQALLVVLGQRVHRGERRQLALGRGHRLQNAAVLVEELPLSRLQLLQRALAHHPRTARRAAVETFTVQAHARSDDQPLHGVLDQ